MDKKDKFKDLMGPPEPQRQLRATFKRIDTRRGQLMEESLPVRNQDGTPRYGAGGTNNPKQTTKKKTVARKKPVAKKKAKTEAQKRYEAQMKARKERQSKKPLGTNTTLGKFGAKQNKIRKETGRKQIDMGKFYGNQKEKRS